MHLARDLADVMPGMRDALLAGTVSVDHAQAGARLREAAGDDQMRTADPVLTDAAKRMDPAELRGWVTAARHSLVPERVAAEEATAFDERELHVASTFRGVGVGNWTLDPVSQEEVTTAIHAASRPVPGDTRTPRQGRADGLIGVCEFYNKHAANLGDSRRHAGDRPQVSVIVGWDTLRQAAGAPTASTGYDQQISAAAARRLACDAKITRIITGPAGEILDVGRASRTFTTAARRAIIARDRRCVWDGCGTPAAWCEAHHIVHWADGGPSDLDNGVLLCGRHHDQIHHRRHPVRIHPDGRRSVHPGHDPWQRLVIDERQGGDVCISCQSRAGPP